MSNKEEFLELLRSTNRPGIEDVIEELENNGFFKAPASAGHHLNIEGGLLQHSLNTCKAALAVFESMKTLEPNLEREVKKDSIIITSLLHDVCKSDIYKPTMKKRKNYMGTWEEVPGYDVSYRDFPMGHGEKSVIMLLYYTGLEITESEMFAIRWHMGPWGLNFNSLEDMRSYDAASTMHPLVSILHCADTLASKIMERTGEENF
ncbi:MAG: HD family phosphohydrolase [Bacteroidales bacterium]|nr:HD family phosphohydrolase [Bacteroidales bacterium]